MMQKTACMAENQTKMGRKTYTRNEFPISDDSMKCQKRKDFSVGVHSDLWKSIRQGPVECWETWTKKRSPCPLAGGRVKDGGGTIHHREDV